MTREENKVAVRSIPLLTEEEAKSIRTPQDVIRIVAYNPEREYLPLPNEPLAKKTQRDVSGMLILVFGSACFVCGLSLVDCMILLTPYSEALALISAGILVAGAYLMYRAR